MAKRRSNYTSEQRRILKTHFANLPNEKKYLTKESTGKLCAETGLTKEQVLQFFINIRRRDPDYLEYKRNKSNPASGDIGPQQPEDKEERECPKSRLVPLPIGDSIRPADIPSLEERIAKKEREVRHWIKTEWNGCKVS